MTALGRDRMILGYPFLWEFNPCINWTNRKLKGGDVTLQSTRFRYLKWVFWRVGETLRKIGQLPEQIIAFLRCTNLAVKLPRGLSVRLERFQVMAIVWERRKMLPAGLR
jgi:hypothetical protein